MLRLEEGTELFSYCISRILAGTMFEILMQNIEDEDSEEERIIDVGEYVEYAVVEQRTFMNERLEQGSWCFR